MRRSGARRRPRGSKTRTGTRRGGVAERKRLRVRESAPRLSRGFEVFVGEADADAAARAGGDDAQLKVVDGDVVGHGRVGLHGAHVVAVRAVAVVARRQLVRRHRQEGAAAARVQLARLRPGRGRRRAAPLLVRLDAPGRMWRRRKQRRRHRERGKLLTSSVRADDDARNDPGAALEHQMLRHSIRAAGAERVRVGASVSEGAEGRRDTPPSYDSPSSDAEKRQHPPFSLALLNFVSAGPSTWVVVRPGVARRALLPLRRAFSLQALALTPVAPRRTVFRSQNQDCEKSNSTRYVLS